MNVGGQDHTSHSKQKNANDTARMRDKDFIMLSIQGGY